MQVIDKREILYNRVGAVGSLRIHMMCAKACEKEFAFLKNHNGKFKTFDDSSLCNGRLTLLFYKKIAKQKK